MHVVLAKLLFAGIRMCSLLTFGLQQPQDMANARSNDTTTDYDSGYGGYGSGAKCKCRILQFRENLKLQGLYYVVTTFEWLSCLTGIFAHFV